MRNRVLAAFAWLSFVIVVAAGCYLALAACDLGLHRIFGLAYCKAHAEPDRLAAERDRARDLRERIHQAELRAAQLPACATRAVEERKRVAEVEPPPKPPEPEPKPPEPKPESQEELIVPRKLSDLKGCWQSVRGDLPMVSDDEEHRPTGTVRICYCFDNKGGGTARYLWTNGSRCVGPLKAKLAPDRLSFSYGRLACTRGQGHVVAADVVCRADAAGESATCDNQSHGRFPAKSIGEKYRRVDDDYCK